MRVPFISAPPAPTSTPLPYPNTPDCIPNLYPTLLWDANVVVMWDRAAAAVLIQCPGRITLDHGLRIPGNMLSPTKGAYEIIIEFFSRCFAVASDQNFQGETR